MIVIVMGVLGAGKTTVGTELAAQLGWEFVDGDSFHPPANVQKLASGIALTDADRVPWLKAIHDALMQWIAEGRNVVLACSALKRSYRDQLCVSPEVRLVYLKGGYDVIRQRLGSRHDHFAKAQLLSSQFETLEEPQDAVTVDVSQTPRQIVEEIRARLALA